jgi:hypothetical protein
MARKRMRDGEGMGKGVEIESVTAGACEVHQDIGTAATCEEIDLL